MPLDVVVESLCVRRVYIRWETKWIYNSWKILLKVTTIVSTRHSLVLCKWEAVPCTACLINCSGVSKHHFSSKYLAFHLPFRFFVKRHPPRLVWFSLRLLRRRPFLSTFTLTFVSSSLSISNSHSLSLPLSLSISFSPPSLSPLCLSSLSTSRSLSPPLSPFRYFSPFLLSFPSSLSPLSLSFYSPCLTSLCLFSSFSSSLSHSIPSPSSLLYLTFSSPLSFYSSFFLSYSSLPLLAPSLSPSLIAIIPSL